MTERPRPPVREACKVCSRALPNCNPAWRVVSPSGLEHIGLSNGDTWCGKDATGPKWWWPL